MPGYVIRQLLKYKYEKTKRDQHSPYQAPIKHYGKDAHNPLPDDDTPQLKEEGVKRVQKVVGSILYYARAVDLMLLMALRSIAEEQSKATKKMMKNTEQLLDYLATHPDATIRYRASDMILNIHSNTSYLS